MAEEFELPLYESRETPSKGQALFARAKIKRGQRIIEEKPSLSYPGTFRTIDLDCLYTKFLTLPLETRYQILQLHGTQYFLKLASEAVSRELPWEAQQDAIRLAAIFQSNKMSVSNRFDDQDRGMDVLCPLAARMNHSCIPNACYVHNPNTKHLTVHALRDIQPEEEITITYLGNLTDSIEKRRKNLEQYEFTCDCPACDPHNIESQQRRHTMSWLSQDLKFFQSRTSQETIPVAGPLPKSMVNDHGAPDPLSAVRALEDLYIKEGLTGLELSGLYYFAGLYDQRTDTDAIIMSLKYLRKALEVDTWNQGEDHHENQDLKRLVSLLELQSELQI